MGEKVQNREDGAIIHKMGFVPSGDGELSFTRADVVLDGVPHDDSSYEVRVFLNNPSAAIETPREPDTGYAGRFSILGHGSCAGGEEHCAVNSAPIGRSARMIAQSIPHPLAPKTIRLTITDALKAMVGRNSGSLDTITLVPVRRAPRKADDGPGIGLFSYTRLRLQTYR